MSDLDGVRLTTLDNGLRVASDAMPSVETVSLGVWAEAGTRHERPEVNGVAHLLEHMAFKGTEKRSARAIAEEIEAVGGHLNAYTSRENTAYYAKLLAEDLPLGLDIIADILQHSVFDPEELARERAVVLQEIGQAEDTPDDIIFDRFQETAYPDQAIGRPVLGTAAIIGEMAPAAVRDYMRSHYSADRLVLAAAGKVDHDRLVDLAARAFDTLPRRCDEPVEEASYQGGEFREERDLEQLHLVLGFPGLAYADPDFYAASVLSTGLYENQRDFTRWEVEERAAKLAYSQAGLGPEDLSLVELHDAFTICEIIHCEGLGLCPVGEGGRLIDEGATAIGGRIPVNPSGGLLAKGHPIGASGVGQIAEIAWQLRGEATGRQVENARVGLAQMMGGSKEGDTRACNIHILVAE